MAGEQAKVATASTISKYSGQRILSVAKSEAIGALKVGFAVTLVEGLCTLCNTREAKWRDLNGEQSVKIC
jgi:hypothetical protein